MKTIFLIDSLWSGHHPIYINFFAKTLLELGNRVVVFCSEPNEVHTWLLQKCPKLTGEFYALEIQEPTQLKGFPMHKIRPAMAARKRWKIAAGKIQYAVEKIGYVPDLVFFAWLDTYLGPYLTHHWVDKVFPYNWSGLYFHIHHLRRKRALLPMRQGIFNPDAVLQSSMCKSVAILDEGVADELQERLHGKPVVVFPDFADDATPEANYPIAKRIKEKSNNRKIIGLLGSLSKRKGLLTLMDIAHRIENKNYFFLFAGKLSTYDLNKKEVNKIHKIRDCNPDNCFFYLDRVPDDSQFNALISICDVVFVAYNKFPSSSNIITKAATFQKPVIVSQGYCLAERAKKYKLGLIIKEGNVREGIDAIAKLCSKKNNNYLITEAMFQEYQQIHSYERLYSSFDNLIANYI